MEVELLIRGYPSRVRFAEWQAANSLPESELPKLDAEQRQRAGKLHISERNFAISLKTRQLAGTRASEKMERVARLIVDVLKKRDGVAQLKTLFWDFYGGKFEFLTKHKSGEFAHSIPGSLVDDFLLEKEDAEKRLKEAVDFELGSWAD